MNVDSILLSEYARVIDGTRLVVVGTFNSATVPSLPAAFPPMYVSLQIEGHRSERGRRSTIELKVLNARRESILEEPLLGQFEFPDSEPKPGMHLRHIHVFGMMGLTFPEVGPYAFEVHIDGTYHAATNFYVDQG